MLLFVGLKKYFGSFILDNILKRIDCEMKAQKKKQIELCDFIGINNNAYTNWKSGFSFSYKKYLPKIAEFLDVDINYLLYGNAPQSENLTQRERLLIKAYRNNPQMRNAVDTLLGINKKGE